MIINVAAVALVFTEVLGMSFLLLAYLLSRQSQKIKDRLEALREGIESGINEPYRQILFSYNWLTKPRKLLHILVAPSLVMGYTVIILIAGATFFFLVVFLLRNLGYTLLIIYTGVGLLADIDALEAYSYSRAVQKASADQLAKGDIQYMETAKETLNIAAIRFFTLGVLFVVAGPFLPRLFESLLLDSESPPDFIRLLILMTTFFLPLVFFYCTRTSVIAELSRRTKYIRSKSK